MGAACLEHKTGTICRYFDADMVEFFEAEDVDSLAAGIVRLHACPERRHTLASNATAKFGARFTWREHRKVYVRLVEALLARTATEG